MTSISKLQERSKGFFPELLGVRFLEAAPEQVRAELIVRDELCTLPGIMHGGAVMAFADTLGAVATMLNLPEGKGTTTIESKTNFFSPGRAGEKVIAECTPLHRGKSTMVSQTRLSLESGKLVALVIQTQMVLDLPTP